MSPITLTGPRNIGKGFCIHIMNVTEAGSGLPLRLAIPLLTLLLAVISIVSGYYLLLSTSPDLPLDYVTRRTMWGIILTLIGGILAMVHIFRRSK